MWDPSTYLRFADERSRPFADLVARIGAPSPQMVVDLGCGPGTLTAELATRWPHASIRGLDTAPEMIAKARSLGSRVDFAVADLRDWVPDTSVGVVISNATLHWVSGHAELLGRWARLLSKGCWIAVQVPGNFDAPSHRAIREAAATPLWRDRLSHLVHGPDTVLTATGYAALMTEAGCTVDAWETTYVHLLPTKPAKPDGYAAHPVLTWIEGTALRPIRAALTDEDWCRFRDQAEARLAEYYPIRGELVYFPFRRVFFVARTGKSAT